jgi:hypothetical protein
VPDDDLPAPTVPAPALRPATRRRPAQPDVPGEAADHDLTTSETDPLADLEAAALAVAAAVDADEADEAVASLDVGPAAAEVAAPAVAVAAPAVKPAAKKTPAKKAAAKKAPAKKAPAKKAPAKKAPAKKAPAAAAALATAPVTMPGAEPAATMLPPVSAPEPPPVHLEELFPATVLPAEPRRLSTGARFLVTLTVLLLAAAAGMGGAALVENGAETWRSTLSVRLVPGAATTGTSTLVAAQTRYAEKLPTFTSQVATVAGVPTADVRHDLAADRVGTDQLRVVAQARTSTQAESLAIRAASSLVKIVPEDQAATVANPADRVTALVSGYVTRAERTRPSDVLALVVGGAAALAVLLLAGSLALLARGRDD